ncbi:MAG TPA: hypothetical protein VGM62_00720 [Chthoniobacterales bacterium]
MNGASPDIQVIKPFNEAVELTKQILFRPFDLKKWFVIGFAAWLAHIGSGGFNPGGFQSYNRPSEIRHNPAWQQWSDTIHQTPAWIVVVIIISFAVFILGLIVLFTWLRSRGLFMFTDCIVRNRAAIVEPWREFKKLGNSFFFLTLLVVFIFLFLGALLAVPLIILGVQTGARHHLGMPFLAIAILWACAVFILAIGWAIVSQLMIPIMYRRRCLAPAGFKAAVSLIWNYPGEITLFCLFLILLGIGMVVVACLATCLTCCVAALPYVGTVILLPVYVCLRSFGLFFLRQFGPDYDAWTAVPAPAAAPIIPPEPPPLGQGFAG